MPNDIGAMLKQAREEARVTQKELAEAIGVSAAAISQFENNRRRPKDTTLQKIAAVLRCNAEELEQVRRVSTIRPPGADEPEPLEEEDYDGILSPKNRRLARQRQASEDMHAEVYHRRRSRSLGRESEKQAATPEALQREIHRNLQSLTPRQLEATVAFVRFIQEKR